MEDYMIEACRLLKEVVESEGSCDPDYEKIQDFLDEVGYSDLVHKQGEDMTILYVTTNTPPLSKAKRIYLEKDLQISFKCPECEKLVWYDHSVPFISYGDYCHVFYCDSCGFESKDKMYQLVNISDNDESVDVIFNKKYGLSLYEYVLEQRCFD